MVDTKLKGANGAVMDWFAHLLAKAAQALAKNCSVCRVKPRRRVYVTDECGCCSGWRAVSCSECSRELDREARLVDAWPWWWQN